MAFDPGHYINMVEDQKNLEHQNSMMKNIPDFWNVFYSLLLESRGSYL